ncbi:hypothetical protein JW835_11105 [bacterium]|nr:hypothetical protein [bacterium]
MRLKRAALQFFKHHSKVKIFSFLCALFLWFYVTRDNQVENTFQIPLHITNQPEDKILIQPLPETVPVLYRGSSGALSPTLIDHSIEIDLSKYPKDTEITLSVEMIESSQSKLGVTPIRIKWDQPISIAYDRYVTKQVPVLSKIEFKPRQGYIQVGDVLLNPDSVKVEGAAREVNEIDAVYTESKVLDVSRPIKGTVSLMDSTSSLVALSEEKVRYAVDIQGIGDRMFAEVPVRIINAPYGIKVSSVPSTLSIHLQGGVEVLKHVKKEDIFATIDYRSRYRYGKRIPAMIHVPPNISFTDVTPRVFELLVER